jgi:hypothetical protein
MLNLKISGYASNEAGGLGKVVMTCHTVLGTG